MSNSFIENVNYVASLDKKYGSGALISVGNLSVVNNDHVATLTMSYYKNSLKELIDNEYTYQLASIDGLNSVLTNFKNEIELLIDGTKFTCDTSFSNTNFIINNIASVSIEVNSLDSDIKICKLNLNIKKDDIIVHDIYGEILSPLKLLPSLALITDDYLNGLVVLGNNEDNINTIVDNIVDIQNSYENAQTCISNALLSNEYADDALASKNISASYSSDALLYRNSAEASADSALSSQNIATTKAAEALSSSNSASISEINAAISASEALDSATSSYDSSIDAFNKAVESTDSANNALASAANANSSAIAAASSESVATTKASEASASALLALNALDEFTDMYLGKKSIAPIADNDGSPLSEGSIYWNTVSKSLFIYDSIAWNPAAFSADGSVVSFNGRSGVITLNENDINTAVGLNINDSISAKQNTLVSGINIKTVNDESILGSGNIEITVGSGGYAANVYLTTLTSTTNGAYKQISYTPQATETIISGVTNNNEVLIASYIFDGDVRTTNIPAGEWGLHYHAKVDSAVGTTVLIFEFFKRSSVGIETSLFSTPTSEINSTVFSMSSLLVTQQLFATEDTDRIGVNVYASTTRTSNVTVDLIVGDGRAMYFTTPLEIRHNQLRARDENNAHPIGAIDGLQVELDSKINTSAIGSTNGVAGLNSYGHVPENQLGSGSGDASKFLRGDGIWSPATTGGGLGAIPFFRADGSRDDINLEALQTLIELTIQSQLSLGNNANILVGNTFGWSDLKSTITTTGGASEPTLKVFRNGIKLPAFSPTQMNEFVMPPHINHDYAPNTKLFPHVHFTVTTTGTGVVRWGFEFTVAAGHQQAGTISVFDATKTVYVNQTIDGTAYKHYVAEVVDADAIGSIAADLAKCEPDSIILCRVFRDATNAADTFTGDAFGITADLHQQVGRFSTKNRTPNFYN